MTIKSNHQSYSLERIRQNVKEGIVSRSTRKPYAESSSRMVANFARNFLDKTPGGYKGSNNSAWKRLANRKMRRVTKERMRTVEQHKDGERELYGYEEMEEALPMRLQEVCDVYDFPTDGLLRYCGNHSDSEWVSRLTRK